jgi:hypothetical protein
MGTENWRLGIEGRGVYLVTLGRVVLLGKDVPALAAVQRGRDLYDPMARAYQRLLIWVPRRI